MPKKSAVGQALVRDQRKSAQTKLSTRHITDTAAPLASVVDANDVDEFMTIAAMNHRNFEADRSHRIVSETRVVSTGLERREAPIRHLQLPRKPKWTHEMTKDELVDLEHQNFLQWRRGIAEAEGVALNEAITPFEKNIDIWRQLWRVIEKSDTIVQILDARNPLFYKSVDLEAYVHEVDPQKQFILLLNKADFLNDEERVMWRDYFLSIKCPFIYFSALIEQEKIDRDESVVAVAPEISSTKVHSAPELLQLLHTKEGHMNIGFVGYPNVGKSSVINVLCGRKRVAVAAQPGKTKHMQTVPITEDLTLLDCPGLIFPSFVSTRAEMLVCGVLPIDQIKDHLSPIELICLRIPSQQLEENYGVKLGGRVSAVTLLQAFATERGYVTGRGLPDEFKAAKLILKDYTTGRIIYTHRPPGQEPPLEPLAPPAPPNPAFDQSWFAQAAPGHIEMDTEGNVAVHSSAKLNKGERRELKFAAQRGQDPTEKLHEIEKRRDADVYSATTKKPS